MEASVEKLRQACERWQIRRFSPEEMVELLEDGESPDWIAEQVLPEAAEDRGGLCRLLGEIAAQVAPAEQSATEDDEPSTPQPAAEGDAPPGANLDLPDLQRLPLPAGVDIDRIEQILASPQGALMADFGAFCQEKGVQLDSVQEEMSTALEELHEEWLQTPRQTLEGKKPSELLAGGRLLPQKVETFRRESPKVGRNDPCPCGSGKKHKKCCGRAA